MLRLYISKVAEMVLILGHPISICLLTKTLITVYKRRINLYFLVIALSNDIHYSFFSFISTINPQHIKTVLLGRVCTLSASGHRPSVVLWTRAIPGEQNVVFPEMEGITGRGTGWMCWLRCTVIEAVYGFWNSGQHILYDNHILSCSNVPTAHALNYNQRTVQFEGWYYFLSD